MKIAPSLLAADFSALGAEVRRVAGADLLHIDVMDGHFVPNLSIGPQIVAALRDKSNLPFDVHLMLSHPGKYIPVFCKAGADRISVHVESEEDPAKLISIIKENGAVPGLAISPKTPVEKLAPYAEQIGFVIVMTVEPGFGGQAMMVEPLEKIRWLKAHYPHVEVEVDGGVNRDTAHLCREAGADVLVAGTAVFRAADPQAEMDALRTL